MPLKSSSSVGEPRSEEEVVGLVGLSTVQGDDLRAPAGGARRSASCTCSEQPPTAWSTIWPGPSIGRYWPPVSLRRSRRGSNRRCRGWPGSGVQSRRCRRRSPVGVVDSAIDARPPLSCAVFAPERVVGLWAKVEAVDVAQWASDDPEGRPAAGDCGSTSGVQVDADHPPNSVIAGRRRAADRTVRRRSRRSRGPRAASQAASMPGPRRAAWTGSTSVTGDAPSMGVFRLLAVQDHASRRRNGLAIVLVAQAVLFQRMGDRRLVHQLQRPWHSRSRSGQHLQLRSASPCMRSSKRSRPCARWSPRRGAP